MNFIEAIRSGFTNYTNFKDRASRSEYWFWVLFTFIGGICTLIVDAYIVGNIDTAPINLIFNIIIFLPGIAVSVRRLHDVNRSGWWLLIMLTGIGIILLLYWTIKAGDKEANKFGSNPLTN